MNLTSKKESVVYLLGDIAVLFISLWLVLSVRYQSLPTQQTWDLHLLPFSLLFLLWIGVYFISGLYEKNIAFNKNKILLTVLKVQVVNSIIAVLFFYFVPFTQITPKVNLFIYLVVSVLLLGTWRYISATFYSKKQIPVCIVARGEDAYYLKKDLKTNLLGFDVTYFFDLDTKNLHVEELIEHIYMNQIEYVILDTKDDAILPLLPTFYNLMFSGVQFIEVNDVYESLYNRVPLQLVKHGWFLEHVKSKPHAMYDFFKRLMDVFASLGLFIGTLFLYPIIFIAIKLEDRGPIIYRDIRVGKDNKIITIFKFRSMTVGIVPETGKKAETKVGKFMRRTRIDEIPQLINVLKGDLSLIGPRPEQPKIVDEYMKTVSFYNIRHLITPGLSGWAQIYHDNHPHHGVDVEATKEKLSYDLYYIKNRSIILDMIIALKTIKTVFLSKGK